MMYVVMENLRGAQPAPLPVRRPACMTAKLHEWRKVDDRIIKLTDVHQREVRRVARLRDQLVDGVLHAERLVELPGDSRERTVGRFVRRPARHVDADGELEGLSGELGRLVGHLGLYALDIELARSPGQMLAYVAPRDIGEGGRRTMNEEGRT